MFEFLLKNPLLFVVMVLLFMAFLVVVILKPKKKKQAKIEKVFATPEKKEPDEVKTSVETIDIEPVKEEQTEEKSEVAEKSDENAVDENVFEKEQKKKKIQFFKPKEQPKIEKVFKRDITETQPDKVETTEVAPAISEEELLSKMQFVKSSKKVSKLKSLTEEELAEHSAALEQAALEQENFDETQHVHEETSQKGKAKHFDRSRRISRCLECGSIDELFCPHLSEKYLNINSDKHLKLDEKFEETLYARTSKMLANSGAKMFSDEDDDAEENYTPSKAFKNDKEYMKDWLEKRRREEFAKLVIGNNVEEETERVDEPDDINLSAKNMLVVGSVMKRKSFRNRA